MDPKTAATVTSPDLLKAFQEGHGLELDDDGPGIKAWVVFLRDNKVIRAAEFAHLVKAWTDVETHLLNGEGYAVGIVMSAHHPAEIETVSDASQ